MKHIGILAHSVEGASLCYLAAVHEGIKRLRAHMHPDITMVTLPMALAMPAWEAGDLATIRDIFLETAERLASAGCDFWVCPDNTAHIALEAPGEPFPIPGLHIADIVAQKAAEEGFQKIGLLGTKWTMEGPVYPAALGRVSCQSLVPGPEDRALMNRIIFDELCNGIFSDAARAKYVRIISELGDRGCDAVALVCTEIPLLITPGDSPLPTLDSTRLLAIAAVDVALGERPLPAWFGGPIPIP